MSTEQQQAGDLGCRSARLGIYRKLPQNPMVSRPPPTRVVLKGALGRPWSATVVVVAPPCTAFTFALRLPVSQPLWWWGLPCSRGCSSVLQLASTSRALAQVTLPLPPPHMSHATALGLTWSRPCWLPAAPGVESVPRPLCWAEPTCLSPPSLPPVPACDHLFHLVAPPPHRTTTSPPRRTTSGSGGEQWCQGRHACAPSAFSTPRPLRTRGTTVLPCARYRAPRAAHRVCECACQCARVCMSVCMCVRVIMYERLCARM
jgi:hypothetical protein